MRTLIQVAKPNMIDDRGGGGEQGEIEQAGQRTIAQRQQLIAGLLENDGAAGVAVDHDRRRGRQQQLRGCSALAHPLRARHVRRARR